MFEILVLRSAVAIPDSGVSSAGSHCVPVNLRNLPVVGVVLEMFTPRSAVAFPDSAVSSAGAQDVPLNLRTWPDVGAVLATALVCRLIASALAEPVMPVRPEPSPEKAPENQKK